MSRTALDPRGRRRPRQVYHHAMASWCLSGEKLMPIDEETPTSLNEFSLENALQVPSVSFETKDEKEGHAGPSIVVHSFPYYQLQSDLARQLAECSDDSTEDFPCDEPIEPIPDVDQRARRTRGRRQSRIPTWFRKSPRWIWIALVGAALFLVASLLLLWWSVSWALEQNRNNEISGASETRIFHTVSPYVPKKTDTVMNIFPTPSPSLPVSHSAPDANLDLAAPWQPVHNCKDNPHARFVVGEETHDCSWLATNDIAIKAICRHGHDAFHLCLKTCRNCSENSLPHQTMTPSSPPAQSSATPAPALVQPTANYTTAEPTTETALELKVPSVVPTSLPAPAFPIATPAAPPSSSPNPPAVSVSLEPEVVAPVITETNFCLDGTEAFMVNGVWLDCIWLSSIPANRMIFCSPGHEAFVTCRKTCNNCP